MKFFELPRRSFVKALSHRTAVILSDAVIIYFITHKVDATIGLVIATNIAATLIYYAHERLWNHIHWGRSLRK